VRTLPEGANWVCELKLDGYSALAVETNAENPVLVYAPAVLSRPIPESTYATNAETLRRREDDGVGFGNVALAPAATASRGISPTMNPEIAKMCKWGTSLQICRVSSSPSSTTSSNSPLRTAARA